MTTEQHNTYGIASKSYQQLLEQIGLIPEIEQVRLFGSRAMGNYHNGSDIDLCLYGQNINQKTLFTLKHNIDNNTIIPYYIDLIIYDSINSDELLKHISDNGIIIYSRKECSQ